MIATSYEIGYFLQLQRAFYAAVDRFVAQVDARGGIEAGPGAFARIDAVDGAIQYLEVFHVQRTALILEKRQLCTLKDKALGNCPEVTKCPPENGGLP